MNQTFVEDSYDEREGRSSFLFLILENNALI